MQLGLTANGSETTGAVPSPRAALWAAGIVAGGGLAFLAATDGAGPSQGLVGTIARAGFWGLTLLAHTLIRHLSNLGHQLKRK